MGFRCTAAVKNRGSHALQASASLTYSYQDRDGEVRGGEQQWWQKTDREEKKEGWL